MLYITPMARKKGAAESIISGLMFVAVFGVLWAFVGGWWWIFPLMFAGVLPALEGVRRLLAERSVKKIDPEQRESLAEKEVLKIAQMENGRVTPAVIALKSSLTIQRAEEVLQKLAARGYTSMEVTDDGRVEYEFPEFRRRIEE